jgi:hypothetical protein
MGLQNLINTGQRSVLGKQAKAHPAADQAAAGWVLLRQSSPKRRWVPGETQPPESLGGWSR